jgi:hypothetical protein
VLGGGLQVLAQSKNVKTTVLQQQQHKCSSNNNINRSSTNAAAETPATAQFCITDEQGHAVRLCKKLATGVDKA